jgi:membrane-associated phospholipid phosphatase
MQKFPGFKMRKTMVFLLISLLLPIFGYRYFDISIAIFFSQNSATTISIFEFITEFGDSKYALTASFVLFLFFRIKQNGLFAARAIFVWFSVALSGIVVDILKPIFARPRPKLFFSDHLYGFEFFKIGHAWSFPSGHSATAFALSFSLLLFFPKYKIQLIFFAILIAFSRIVLNAHFFSDVAVGSLIGGLTVMVLQKYFANHKCYNIYQNSCTLAK